MEAKQELETALDMWIEKSLDFIAEADCIFDNDAYISKQKECFECLSHVMFPFRYDGHQVLASDVILFVSLKPYLTTETVSCIEDRYRGCMKEYMDVVFPSWMVFILNKVYVKDPWENQNENIADNFSFTKTKPYVQKTV